MGKKSVLGVTAAPPRLTFAGYVALAVLVLPLVTVLGLGLDVLLRLVFGGG